MGTQLQHLLTYKFESAFHDTWYLNKANSNNKQQLIRLIRELRKVDSELCKVHGEVLHKVHQGREKLTVSPCWYIMDEPLKDDLCNHCTSLPLTNALTCTIMSSKGPNISGCDATLDS